MFRSQVLRQSARALRASPSPIVARRFPAASFNGASSQRYISNTAPLTSGKDDVGHNARTDDSIQVEYPEEGELPSSIPVQGRGGRHQKRTLASFSLQGKVGVVTGGARGLGLVMSQAMVISGADIAIVDLNSAS